METGDGESTMMAALRNCEKSVNSEKSVKVKNHGETKRHCKKLFFFLNSMTIQTKNWHGKSRRNSQMRLKQC
jgi:hypothetical protein